MIRAWMDFIFPPLCQVCSEPCATRLMCSECWELSVPVDPKGRCRHCFVDMEQEGICQKCRREPVMPMISAFVFESSAQTMRLYREAEDNPEAIAAFVYLQWERLGWAIPDAIIPLQGVQKVSQFFAFWLGLPSIRLFKEGDWECDCNILEEDQTLLLIGETHSTSILRAAEALSGAFPKKIYALSLFSKDFVS